MRNLWFFILMLVCIQGGRAEPLPGSAGWSLTKISQAEGEDNTYGDSPIFFNLQPPDARPAISVDARIADRLRSGELTAEEVYNGRTKNAAAAEKDPSQADPVNSTLTREDGRSDSFIASDGEQSGISGLGGSASGSSTTGSVGASSPGGSQNGAPGGLSSPNAAANSSTGASSSASAGTPNPLQSDEPPPGSAARELASANPSTSGQIKVGTVAPGPGISVVAASPPDFKEVTLADGGLPKCVPTPGSITYTEDATLSLPCYNSITVTLKAGGGGAAGICYFGQGIGSKPGGDSTFGSSPMVVAHGGKGGIQYTSGAPGTAQGGDANVTGGGAKGQNGYLCGFGGNGGFAKKTFNKSDAGAPAQGAPIKIKVGKGGEGGITIRGKFGDNGSVFVSWQ